MKKLLYISFLSLTLFSSDKIIIDLDQNESVVKIIDDSCFNDNKSTKPSFGGCMDNDKEIKLNKNLFLDFDDNNETKNKDSK